MRVSDTVAGATIIVVAGLMIYLTLSFPPFPGQKFGPSLFPRVLAAGMILCGGLLIWRARGNADRQPAIALMPWTREPWRAVSFLLIPALTLAYIFLSETIGFIPCAFALLLILFLWFGVRAVVALPVAVAATLVIHWFFATMMRVPLPRGLLTTIL